MYCSSSNFINHHLIFLFSTWYSHLGGVGSLVADFDISPISICSSDEDPPRRLKFAATFRGASNEVEKEAVINKNTEGADEASSEGKEGEKIITTL